MTHHLLFPTLPAAQSQQSRITVPQNNRLHTLTSQHTEPLPKQGPECPRQADCLRNCTFPLAKTPHDAAVTVNDLLYLELFQNLPTLYFHAGIQKSAISDLLNKASKFNHSSLEQFLPANILITTTENPDFKLLHCYTGLVFWKTGSNKPAAQNAQSSHHSIFNCYTLTYFRYIYSSYKYTNTYSNTTSKLWDSRHISMLKIHLRHQCHKTANLSSGAERGVQELMLTNTYWSKNLVNKKMPGSSCGGRVGEGCVSVYIPFSENNCNQECDKRE